MRSRRTILCPIRPFCWLLVGTVFPFSSARATYSIVACDAQTRACGVAVQTNNLAVGASVPYAQADVGAVATQFETNPRYGPRGLALLAAGQHPDAALKQLLEQDGSFGGEGIEARQVGIVSVDGRSASYTGAEAAQAAWAGERKGAGYSMQGNGLAGDQVLEAMDRAFQTTSGPLAERLLAALAAGDAAGGQRTGRESAALLVRTTDGFPMDVDLRVDHSNDPVAELRRLYEIQAARQQVAAARIAARKGQFEQARSLLIAGVARAPGWPRAWIQAARVAISIEEPGLALQYLSVAFAENPAWIPQELGAGTYAELGADPIFHRWVNSNQESDAIAAYDKVRAGSATSEERMRTVRKLLEAGHSREALDSLQELPSQPDETEELTLLRATTWAANGRFDDAIEVSKKKGSRGGLRTRLRLARLEMLAHTRSER